MPPEKDAVTRLILDELQRADLREREVVDGREAARARARPTRPTARTLLRLSRGLTSEMIAACAKLMTNMDLVVRGAEDPRRRAREQHRRAARPAVDPPAAQPPVGFDRGHPGVAARRAGASAPATRSSASTRSPTIPERPRRSSNATGDFMRQWRIPTQNCCLAHVTTQMKALEQGAQLGPDVPVDRRHREGAAQLRRDAAAARRGART